VPDIGTLRTRCLVPRRGLGYGCRGLESWLHDHQTSAWPHSHRLRPTRSSAHHAFRERRCVTDGRRVRPASHSYKSRSQALRRNGVRLICHPPRAIPYGVEGQSKSARVESLECLAGAEPIRFCITFVRLRREEPPVLSVVLFFLTAPAKWEGILVFFAVVSGFGPYQIRSLCCNPCSAFANVR